MVFTADDERKLELLDKLFASLNIEDLRRLTESEEIVAKLKGINTTTSVISGIVKSHAASELEVVILRGNLSELKSDIQLLVKTISDLYVPKPYSQDLQTLKTKYGVYY